MIVNSLYVFESNIVLTCKKTQSESKISSNESMSSETKVKQLIKLIKKNDIDNIKSWINTHISSKKHVCNMTMHTFDIFTFWLYTYIYIYTYILAITFK